MRCLGIWARGGREKQAAKRCGTVAFFEGEFSFFTATGRAFGLLRPPVEPHTSYHLEKAFEATYQALETVFFSAFRSRTQNDPACAFFIIFFIIFPMDRICRHSRSDFQRHVIFRHFFSSFFLAARRCSGSGASHHFSSFFFVIFWPANFPSLTCKSPWVCLTHPFFVIFFHHFSVGSGTVPPGPPVLVFHHFFSSFFSSRVPMNLSPYLCFN